MRRLITLLAIVSLTLPLMAQTKLTAGSRLQLHQARQSLRKAPSASDPTVDVIIQLNGAADRHQLQACGAKVRARFNSLVTASVPLSRLADICRMGSVRQVAMASTVELCNDSALTDAHVLPLAAAEGFASAYDGRGVVVGVIDSGVDFNHINFRDSQGGSRVMAAYLPQDTTGSAPVIDGDTLPGSHYDTPQLIAQLTTDTRDASHGTHTTGTAAGSYMAGGLQGVAPAAHLVICAMPLLYDSDIINSIKYIFDYATRMGLPAVINMSFASSIGPHDGTSDLCRVFDEVSGPGRILSISAHNSGLTNLHLPYSFKSDTDTLQSMIDLYSTSFNTEISLWSSSGHRHQMALMLVDKTQKQVVLEMPFFGEFTPDSVFSVQYDSIPQWNQYMTGEMMFATAVEDGDRTHSLLVNRGKPFDTTRYRLGIKVISDGDPAFHAWATGGSFFRGYLPGYTSGTRVGSISDLCTGEQAISVGAYITKQTYPLAAGGTFVTTRATPMYDATYFTAWGPDARGISRPDICAPGMVTISSVSRYDNASSLVSPTGLSVVETVEGVGYPYGASYGTSMSAPVMTGTIALWLQAHPQLSPDDVRDILNHTARRDQWVTQGDARQWGRGKLDASAGMHYLLRKLNGCDVNADGVVDVADVNRAINVVLGIVDIDLSADVNGDSMVDVTDVNAIINALLNN